MIAFWWIINRRKGNFGGKVAMLISTKITEVCVQFAPKKKKNCPAALDQFLDSISIKLCLLFFLLQSYVHFLLRFCNNPYLNKLILPFAQVLLNLLTSFRNVLPHIYIFNLSHLFFVRFFFSYSSQKFLPNLNCMIFKWKVCCNSYLCSSK